MTMNDYHIITASVGFSQKKAVEELQRKVNEALARGWKPVGGVALSGTWLIQAVLKQR